MKIINLLQTFAIIILGNASETSGDIMPNWIPEDGIRDEYNCLINSGYSWCDSLGECVREWDIPCPDNHVDCKSCLKRQRKGENIACPVYCDNLLPQQIPEVNNVVGISNNDNDNDNNECQINPLACHNSYVCPKVTEVTQCSEGGIDGYTTYRLSVLIQPNMNIKNIYAIYGEQAHTMYWPPVYQIDGPFDSDIGGVSPSIVTISPDSNYDSWITIGLTDGDPENKLSTIGIDFNSWTEDSSVLTDNGAVFLMDPREVISQDEYIIAQITVPNNGMKIMNVNIQGETYETHINKETWTEYDVEFILYPEERYTDDHIPLDCSLWYDGCNLCQVMNGELGACTRTMCLTNDDPECRLFDNGSGQSGH